MRQTVWKFPITGSHEELVKMPPGSQPLAVGLDGAGQLCIWAKTFPEIEERVERQVFTRGTGAHDLPINGEYLGTHIEPLTGFVWHVFVSKEGGR